MQVVEEEYEVKQMKDMAAARKRWDAMVILELWAQFLGFFLMERMLNGFTIIALSWFDIH